MNLAATHSSVTPWVLLSAVATAIGILTAAVKIGGWVRSVEDRLARYQEDLSGLGDAVTALERSSVE